MSVSIPVKANISGSMYCFQLRMHIADIIFIWDFIISNCIIILAWKCSNLLELCESLDYKYHE